MQAHQPVQPQDAATRVAPPGFPWRAFLGSLARRLDSDNVVGLSAEVSYYFSLALFPFLIFLAALVGVLPFTHFWDGILAWITHYLPADVQSVAFDAVASLTQGRKQFLSLGLLGSIWAASGGLTTLMSALNAAYEVKETRSYWRRMGLAVVLLLVLALLLIATFGLFSAGHALDTFVASKLGVNGVLRLPADLARWLVSVLLTMLCIAILDHFLPNLKRPWQWITPGTAIVVASWIVSTLGFNFYVTHIATYHRTYGVLGGFVVLMVWIYILALIGLIGAEVNSELNKVPR
jgi:membrane protein